MGGYDAILVVVDRLTKMAYFIPTRESVSVPQVAKLFISHVFRLHGLPRSIMSDRDTRFTTHFWTTVFDALKTKLGMSSGDHPETDGQTESQPDLRGYADVICVIEATYMEQVVAIVGVCLQ